MVESKYIVALTGLPDVVNEGLTTILKENDIECVVESNKAILSTQYSCIIISEDEYFSNIDFWHGRNILIFMLHDNIIPDTAGIVSIFDLKNDIVRKCLSLLNQGTKTTELHSSLSAREFDVLREIASGKTFKEIADTLNISVNTVVTHRKSISAKLGIRSTSGLSVYAMMHKLL